MPCLLPTRLTVARLLLGSLALLWGVFPSVGAQSPPDTLVFETVGDVPMDMDDIAFGPDGVLWATNGDVWRLSASSVWEEINDLSFGYVLPLSVDTLVAGNIVALSRSVDAGETFAQAHNEGGALFATALEGPNDGLLVAGTGFNDDNATGFAYSTDRGATWTDAEVITGTTWHPEAFAFAEIPSGPHQGRLIGGAMNGIFLSDDGGRTWTESSLVQNGRYIVDSVVLGADGRVWASVQDGAVPGGQAYVSADDGATWTHAATFPYPVLLAAVPGPPEGDGALYAMQVAAAQSGGGVDLHRSYDGAVWTLVGTLPGDLTVRFVWDVEIGPDGRLYVTVSRPGGDEEWVYRTTEPVVVSNEPVEVPAEAGGAVLRVWPNPTAGTARVALTLAQPGAVRLAVYDALGREVAVLADGWREAGEHAAVFDGRSLASGVYLVRASVDRQAVGRAQRLLLMK